MLGRRQVLTGRKVHNMCIAGVVIGEIYHRRGMVHLLEPDRNSGDGIGYNGPTSLGSLMRTERALITYGDFGNTTYPESCHSEGP